MDDNSKPTKLPKSLQEAEDKLLKRFPPPTARDLNTIGIKSQNELAFLIKSNVLRLPTSEVPVELIEAYYRTQYRLQTDNGVITLRIAQPCQELVALMKSASAEGGAFITAENPFSQSLSAAENKERQDRLREDLASLGVLIINGAGQGEDPDWPAEASYAAIGVTREQACELGVKYEQNAIVWFDNKGTGELILLR